MGRNARVMPFDRHASVEALNNHAGMIEALRDEVLAQRDRMIGLEQSVDRSLKYLEGRLDDQRLSGQTEPLKRNLRGRLRWLRTGY